MKATPLVLLGLLLARSRRAAAAMVVTLVVLAALATAVLGPAPWRAFIADAPRDVAVWATWLANTASLQGVLARLFAPSRFSLPLVARPAVSRVGFLIASVALLAAMALVGWRLRPLGAPLPAAPDGERDADRARALALWSAAGLALPVLLNPLAWSHVVVMLLAPCAIGWRDGGPRARAVTALALAALSLPRQRLMAWAGPIPVRAGPALVLGVHAAAALALYGALLGACWAASISSMRARTLSSSA
jgi:hypothetical protein